MKTFEEKYKIKLPENYRTFIKEIGNGWKVTQIGGKELRSCNSLTECGYDEKGISRRFKYTDSWIWEEDEEATDRKINNALKNGSMSLMELGDGMTYQLIVTGPSAGQIWLFTGEGVTPYGICSDFFDWVNDVLDGNMEM